MTLLQLRNETAIAAEHKFVARGQAIFNERFPDADFAFSDPIWNVRALETRRHQRTNAAAYFTRAGSLTEPLPAAFADVLKAACLVDLGSKSHLLTRVNAVRILWEAILQRLPDGISGFTWRDVGEADFLAAEQRMLARWALGTTHLSCGSLARLAEVLAAAGILRSLQIPFRTPRPARTYQFTLASRDAYEARLPSREAIMGVADIYARFAVDPKDRLLACVLAVLVATGLRIGEVLTLACDCLVSEGQGDDRKWGIRFAKEKSVDRRRVLETRWLTAAQAVLARAAIAEVLTLTEGPRDRARILEAYPKTVALPDISWHAELTTDQVAELLGVAPETVKGNTARLPRRRIKVEGAADVLSYRAADVMQYLHGQRGPLWVVDRGDGSRQMLSDTLFITFRNAFADAYRVNSMLVDNVVERTVNDFLGGRSQRDGQGGVHVIVRSAFERFDIRERDGRIVEMTSHGFRHWVTTQAAIGGVDDALLARWQNREHTRDLRAYKHLSPAERVAVVRDALQRGQMRGRLAQMYFALHEDVRDVFLEDQLQAVHVTPFGICVHDFKVAPCPKHLNCLKRCRDYLHDTADPDERSTLIQLEISTSRVLDQAKRQLAQGADDLSEHWVAEAEDTLAGVRAALAAEPTTGTTWVRPFAEDESRFQSIATD